MAKSGARRHALSWVLPSRGVHGKNPAMAEVSYPIDFDLQQQAWNLKSSFAYCMQLARSHYENFPVGSVLIPKALRPHVCALYAFARRADDIADEDFVESDRIPALEAWQALLEKSLQGHVNHPVFLALGNTMQTFSIPQQLLIDLLTAFKMDVKIKRQATFQEVLYYCQHSANPVGRLVLHLFGYHDEERMVLSDKICTALQLANFWQDVAVDLKKNRIYIPQEDFKTFGYSEQELLSRQCNENFQKLLKFQVDRTDALFREGAALIDLVSGRLKLELKCVVLGGMGVLTKIRQLNYNTLATRPAFNATDKIKILLSALFGFKRKTRFNPPPLEIRTS